MFALIVPLSGFGGSPEHPIYLPPGSPTQPMPPGIWPQPPGQPGTPTHPIPPVIWPGPMPPAGSPMPPIYIPPEIWPGVPPGYPTHPIQPQPGHPIALPEPPVGSPEHPIALPPGTVWPPLDPGAGSGKVLAFVYLFGIGYKWTVLDLSAGVNPTPPGPPRPK